MAKVLVSIPSYGGKCEVGMLFPLMRAAKEKGNNYTIQNVDSSTNCHGFNMLLNNALDARDLDQITHFAMIHTDVIPEEYWLDKMLAIMERTNADVLSAVIPIKDHQGLTSTALDEQVGDVDPAWRVRRITLNEIYKTLDGVKLEPSFTHPKLLVNTGLMLIDLRKPWIDKLHFRFEHQIIRHHGKRSAVCMPEDWAFSRDARALGATLWATREVAVRHVGYAAYPNSYPWGALKKDELPVLEPNPVLDTMESIPGYFTRDEGSLLQATARKALDIAPAIVEIGSYKGRSTSVLGACAREKSSDSVVYAIDPHEGDINLPERVAPSLEAFEENIKRADVASHVRLMKAKSQDVVWTGEPIGLLFIDGIHDAENVARDYHQFAHHLAQGAFVAFHDVEPTYPGVVEFVSKLQGYEPAGEAGSLKVFKKVGG